MIEVLGYQINESGCGNHGCLVKKPKGQATNNCCQCFSHIPMPDRMKLKKIFTEKQMKEKQ